MPDTVWSADFMSDALANGRRFRTFNVVDDFDRDLLYIEVDYLDLVTTTGSDLRAVAARPWAAAGAAHRQWLGVSGRGLRTVGRDQRLAIQYIQPGKPNQNAYIERFNRKFREEVLDRARLDNVREAAYW